MLTAENSKLLLFIAFIQRYSLLSSRLTLTALLPLVILNECMTVAFYSTFSNSHWGGVRTALGDCYMAGAT